MPEKNDVVGEAIARTFSRSKIDGPLHDAEKEVASMDNSIELTMNRIALHAEDMKPDEINRTMEMLMQSLLKFTEKVQTIQAFRPWDKK